MSQLENKKQWYVVNTYAGHENRVKENLEKRLETMGISYDMDDVSPDSADTTIPSLPFGPMPKEKTSGNIIPMPQRKVM